MFPKTIAIVEDDSVLATFLARYLEQQGIAVTTFGDSDDFLLADGAFDFDFYIVDLTLPGVDGLDLVRLLRRRVQVGIVVVTARVGAEVFDAALGAGADMYLTKPVGFEQIGTAVKAVHRRSVGITLAAVWQLNRKSLTLLTPKKVSVDLSAIDLAILQCFVAADGGSVTPTELA